MQREEVQKHDRRKVIWISPKPLVPGARGMAEDQEANFDGDDRPISPAIRFNAGHSLRRVVWFLGFRFSSKRSLTTTGSGVKSMRQAEAIRQPSPTSGSDLRQEQVFGEGQPKLTKNPASFPAGVSSLPQRDAYLRQPSERGKRRVLERLPNG